MVKIFERLHIPLWIIKDMFWMLGYGELSLTFAVPTILLSVALIVIKTGSERLMEMMMGCWLTANTLWMMHELFHTDTKEFALCWFVTGILVIPIYLLKVKEEK
jgi:hypothetical protein